jgi:hypothetical protein
MIGPAPDVRVATGRSFDRGGTLLALLIASAATLVVGRWIAEQPKPVLPYGADGKRDRIATPAEAATLLAAIPETERALWACTFYAGLRRGELSARCAGGTLS